MSVTLAPIVEGHGDEAAIPLLIRMLYPGWVVQRPIRVPKGKIVRVDELSRYLQLAKANLSSVVEGHRAILLVFDADEDCAAKLAPSLRQQLQEHIDIHLILVIAVREYESWIVAGSDWASDSDSPDTLTNPKRLIIQRYGTYRETVDQPRLTAKMDIERAKQKSRSFDYFLRTLKLLESQSSNH